MKTLARYALLVFLFAAWRPGVQREAELIEWSADRKLRWEDFRGKPEKRFAAASTHYDILKELRQEKDHVVLKIRAVFFKNRSWKKKRWINEEVLIHEQKHFDIVELYARKMRKALCGRPFSKLSDIQAELESVYNRLDQEMDRYQDLYDEESEGSMNGEAQRAWNRKISAELDSLSVYKADCVFRLEH